MTGIPREPTQDTTYNSEHLKLGKKKNTNEGRNSERTELSIVRTRQGAYL